jgi:hypothetical protein
MGFFALIVFMSLLEFPSDLTIHHRPQWDSIWVVLSIFGSLSYAILCIKKKRIYPH